MLERLLEESQDAIVIADRSGIITLFNRAAERLSGKGASDVVGKLRLSELSPPGVSDELRRRFNSERFGGRGRLEPFRTQLLEHGGERIAVSVAAFSLKAEGAMVAVVCLIRDLREQLRLEEQLAREQAQRGQGERQLLLSELGGTAAHELNQPLTSIMGYAELLRRHVPDEHPDAPSLDIIVREAERMADIIRKIGRVNRYETKSYVGDARIVDLDRAIATGKDEG